MSPLPHHPRTLAGSFVLAATLTLAGACNSGPPTPDADAIQGAEEVQRTIVGTWIYEPEQGKQTLVLTRTGEAAWIFQGAFEDIYSLTYRVDYTAEPHTFDLQGFDRGPLDGFDLFGIVELIDDDSFRWNANPGHDSFARPKEFIEEDTVIFHRAEG